MKRISMILSVMALVFAFTIATVSAQNVPTKSTTEKVVSEKSDKADVSTDKKDAKAGCSSKTEAKAGCATPCSGEKAKACCSKGTSSADAAKPVPASDKK